MRKLTQQVAFDGAWDSTRAEKVGALFDSLAAGWSEDHVNETKAAPILDALDRGSVSTAGRWLELGSGTGAGTRVLHNRVASLVALDLAAEMLSNAPGELAPRVRGDASVLPFGDDAFDVVMMVNMLLFPAEVNRVVAPGGSVVWINTLGDQTPIHLPAADVVAALPGTWSGVTARAGTGFWATLSRGRRDPSV
jgi:ubiquinone/menaquinone biosynthesis C-methylase UbiE